MQQLEARLEGAAAEREALQAALDEAVWYGVDGGCAAEAAMQDELVPVVEEWAARGRCEGTPLPLSALVAGWANRCGRTQPHAAEYRLDPELGFTDADRELGAAMLMLNRMLPSLVGPARVDGFVEEVDPKDRARLAAAAMRDAGLPAGCARPAELAVNDGRGLVRVHLLAALLLRGLDAEPGRHAGGRPRMHWDSDDARMDRRRSATFAFDGTVPAPPPDAPQPPNPANPDEPEPPPGRRMKASEWCQLVCKLRSRAGRVATARHALQDAILHDALLTAQDPETGTQPTAVELRDAPSYTAPSPEACALAAEVAAADAALRSRDEDDDEKAHAALAAAAPGDDPKAAEAAVESVRRSLAERYRVMRKVYRYYACSAPREGRRGAQAAEASVLEMSQQEWKQFVDDIGVAGRTTPAVDVRLGQLFRVGKDKLSPQSFTSAVVLLAAAPVTDAISECNTAGERVSHLIDAVIDSGADYVSNLEFRQACHRDRTEAVLLKYRDTLKRIFVHYACGKETGDARMENQQKGAAKREVSWPEFRQLMVDCEVIDERCPQYAIYQVFTKTQEDYNMALSFPEFMDTLCAVAAYKSPAPYLPLHIRVRRFFESTMLPPLKKKNIPGRRRSTV